MGKIIQFPGESIEEEIDVIDQMYEDFYDNTEEVEEFYHAPWTME